MEKVSNCPNFTGCQIVNIEGFVPDMSKKDEYINNYCYSDNTKCKRFQTKKALGFCPPFVLPDCSMTLDEIMEKCEKEM